MTKAKKDPYDKTSSKHQDAHLGRLAEGGGRPVRVDTAGADLALLDELVASGYAPSRSDNSGMEQRLVDRTAEVKALGEQLAQARVQFEHFQEAIAA